MNRCLYELTKISDVIEDSPSRFVVLWAGTFVPPSFQSSSANSAVLCGSLGSYKLVFLSVNLFHVVSRSDLGFLCRKKMRFSVMTR